MRAVIAPVKNISRFSSAMEAVAANEHRDERMVLIHGATGVGKSTALAYFMNRFNAVYAEASPPGRLARCCAPSSPPPGIYPRGRAADMERQIVDEMMGEGRPLFIDEMDYLFLPGSKTSLRMLETLHSIHDKSRMPVVMVGMDKIDRKLKLREQIARRIDQWVLFSDLDRDDARAVADHLSEVHIENDLLDLLYAATQGRMGRIRLASRKSSGSPKGKNGIGSTLNAGESPMATRTIRHARRRGDDSAPPRRAGRASTCLEQHAVFKVFTTEQIEATAGITRDNLRKYIKALHKSSYLRIARPKQNGRSQGIRFGG